MHDVVYRRQADWLSSHFDKVLLNSELRLRSSGEDDPRNTAVLCSASWVDDLEDRL
jgi:hypothetical protein